MWNHYIFAYYLLLLFYNVIATYHGNTSLYTSNEKRNLVTFATTSAFSGHPPPTMKTDGPFKPLTLEFCTLVLLYKLKKVNMSRMALSKVHCKEKRNDVLLTTRTLEHKSSAKQWATPSRRTPSAEYSILGACRCLRWSAGQLVPLPEGPRPSAARHCWRTARAAGLPSRPCHTRWKREW